MVMQVQKIDPTPRKLPDLMNGIGSGEIRIPGFQRDFVWEPSRIQKLLDSMCKEYPVGTILLWRAPSEYNNLVREIDFFEQPEVVKDQRYQFLLDGQQRLTSLFVTINGLTVNDEDYSKIVVDLDVDIKNESELKERLLFRHRSPDNQQYISVNSLLGSESLQVFKGIQSEEYQERFMLYSGILKGYPFSVVTISEMSIDDAIEIFERINRQGRRLTRYDLITASIFSEEFDLRQKTEDDILNPMEDQGFGIIAESTIPQSLALNIAGNTEHNTQIRLKGKDVADNWDRTVECYKKAISLMKRHFGVFHSKVVPYDSMVAVLAYYYFHSQVNEIAREHLAEMEKWFWKVTFSERYSGASQTRMSEDASWIRQLVSDNNPFGQNLSATIDTIKNSRVTYTTSAVRNGTLCLFCVQEPRHPLNGTKLEITLDQYENMGRTTVHRIFPNALVRNRNAVNRLANFAFFPEEVTNELDINNSRPSEYVNRLKDILDTDFDQVMLSHLIPIDEDSGIWVDDFDLFIEQRAKLMLARVFQRAGVIGEALQGNKAVPVALEIEKAIRDNIHVTLTKSIGANYWGSAVPEWISNKIRKEYNSKGKDIDYDDLPNRDRLDYASPSHYWRLIEANISSFPDQLRNNAEKYLKDWQEFRNTTAHARDADTLLAARAVASFIWLSRVLNLDLSKYGIV